MAFKVGDKVRTNADWSSTHIDEGVVEDVLDGGLLIRWPNGMHHVDAHTFFVSAGNADVWPSVSTDTYLEIVKPKVPQPGDRVRANSKSAYEGCEGTVTYSVRDNGRPVVLITSDPVCAEKGLPTDVGRRFALPVNELEVIAKPVVQTTQNNLGEGLDEFLFNL